MNRAETRHQKERAKHRAVRFLTLAGLPVTEKMIAVYSQQRRPCSCAMCGNPRRAMNERTRDEVLAQCKMIEAMAEFGVGKTE